MFSVGDILLKVDVRGVHSPDFNTRHHAMLVVGVTEDNQLTIAHMKFTNFENKTGELVIEPLPHYKDLIHIQCPQFTQELRERIKAIAYELLSSGVLYINNILLEEEYDRSRQYRGEDFFQNQIGLTKIKELPFSPVAVMGKDAQFMSCHAFVLSTVHVACTVLGTPIPAGLQLPPELAWADILYASILRDPELKVAEMPRDFSVVKSGFFAPQPKPIENPPERNCCVLL